MTASARYPGKLYGESFHADRDDRTRQTAQTILKMIQEWIGAASICDVGCGVGSWLAAAQESGFETAIGFEGPWAQTANLVVDSQSVNFQDLETSVSAQRVFDLVISLEVAEHLSEARAGGFVADLCALGDCVLFSAAIPHQGGTGHINERWQSYWAEHFSAQDFVTFDPVRPIIWNNPEIAFWYRQNMLIYARRGSAAAEKLAALGHREPQMLDIVHPDQYIHAEESQPQRALARTARRILGRT